MQELSDNFRNGTYDIHYIYSLCIFLFQYYKELLVLVLITLLYFSIKKKYVHLIIFAILFILFLMLINLSNYGFYRDEYQETVYFPLSFVVAYTFIFFVADDIKSGSYIVRYLLILSIIVSRFVAISNEGKSYSSRINKMQQLVEHCRAFNGNKFIVGSAYLKQNEPIDISWTYPIETMLLSGINPELKTITICTDDDMNYSNNKEKIQKDNFLMRRWNIENDKSINQHYFHLEDSDYINLNTK